MTLVCELNGSDGEPGLALHCTSTKFLLLVFRENRKIALSFRRLNKESSMNSCDWTDCSLEVGLFDGAPRTLLSSEGRKNIPVEKNRFINLCPHHFELGVASVKPTKFRTKISRLSTWRYR